MGVALTAEQQGMVWEMHRIICWLSDRWVNAFHRYRLDKQELYQEAMTAICVATPKYDPKKYKSFRNFAMWRARDAIRRYVSIRVNGQPGGLQHKVPEVCHISVDLVPQTHSPWGRVDARIDLRDIVKSGTVREQDVPILVASLHTGDSAKLAKQMGIGRASVCKRLIRLRNRVAKEFT